MSDEVVRAEIRAALREAKELLSRVEPELRPAYAGPVLEHLLGSRRPSGPGRQGSAEGAAKEVDRPADLADLYHACAPNDEKERALVAAYWVQEVEGKNPFDSQSANSALKNLGYPISNITRALTELMSERPQLVVQVQKSGPSQQARKKYRVTDAGKRAIATWRSGTRENGSG